ncbi:Presequence protease, mitochondrial [Chytriomyces hyalinus]|nr:Presequence protease, mitochondrial [Chytriomyces hyalinus]
MFHLESEQTDALNGSVRVFKHTSSGMRIVFASVGGPVASAQIVVPTGADDNKGCAHTLEHLIFCGSKQFPRRGYLDTLATRSLSTGSNAYTADDHTSYSIVTAGAEGLARVLPVLLDHVLHPTLTDHQFMTEVYHVDGAGAEQGVVYCEMAGREHTEADVTDLRIRQLLFPGTAYAYECGGQTDAIRNLTNNDIKNYHDRFYSLDTITILICGTVEPLLIFEALKTMDVVSANSLGKGANNTAAAAANSIRFVLPKDADPLQSIVDTVTFPSQDEAHGSMMFAWRGPMSSEFRDIVALDIVLRYLQDSSASPLYQAFVENDEPWAAEVDYDVKSYLQSALVLYFSGVKCESSNADADTDGGPMDEDAATDDGNEDWEDDEDDEDDSSSGDEDDDEDEDDTVVVVEPAAFKDKLMTLLESFTRPGSIVHADLERTIDRYRRKIMEAFEEDPHEVVANYIMPEIVRYHLESPSNVSSKQESPLALSRGSVLRIIGDLAKEPLDFWSKLIQTWLVSQPVVQVIAKPSRAEAARLADQEATSLKARKDALGEDGLALLGVSATDAFTANKVNLPESVLAAFPSIPNVSKLPQLECSMSLHNISMAPSGSHRALMQAQVVSAETLFSHCRIVLNIANLPAKLRPYLVLFQELVFQSPVSRPSGKALSYQDAIKKTSEIFVSNEAAVGFGNDMWSCGWLADTFMVSISSDIERFDAAVQWLIECLLFTKFTKERIVSCVQKLLSDLMDVKRDGSCVLSAVTTRLTSTRKKTPKETQQQSTGACDNDLAISVFSQEAFLTMISKKLKTDGVKGLKVIVDALQSLRTAIVAGTPGLPGFVQLGAPLSIAKEPVLEMFLKNWDTEVALFMGSLNKSVPSSAGKKGANPAVAFPFPRSPLDMTLVDTKRFGNGVLVPVEGVTASYMSIIVPCDVLKTADYYAVTLLAELLSRAEGPLYTSIRGKGYAYDASLNLAAWSGQLTFDLSESSDPQRALVEFFRILKALETDDGFAELASSFNIETARASVMYRVVTEKATGGGCIGASLRRCLRGFITEEQEAAHQRALVAVTAQDLKRIYKTYFSQFFHPKGRIATLVTKAQKAAALETMKASFAELDINLKIVKSMKEFEIK